MLKYHSYLFLCSASCFGVNFIKSVSLTIICPSSGFPKDLYSVSGYFFRLLKTNDTGNVTFVYTKTYTIQGLKLLFFCTNVLDIFLIVITDFSFNCFYLIKIRRKYRWIPYISVFLTSLITRYDRVWHSHLVTHYHGYIFAFTIALSDDNSVHFILL